MMSKTCGLQLLELISALFPFLPLPRSLLSYFCPAVGRLADVIACDCARCPSIVGVDLSIVGCPGGFGTEFPDDTRSVTHSPETGGNLFARDESGYHDSRGLAYALPINAILSSYGRILVTSRLFPPLDPGKFSVDREVIVSFIGGASSIRLSETSGLRHDVGVEPRYVGVEPRYVAEVMLLRDQSLNAEPEVLVAECQQCASYAVILLDANIVSRYPDNIQRIILGLAELVNTGKYSSQRKHQKSVLGACYPSEWHENRSKRVLIGSWTCHLANMIDCVAKILLTSSEVVLSDITPYGMMDLRALAFTNPLSFIESGMPRRMRMHIPQVIGHSR
ncbi:uncharacterized protein BO96DRAFT_464467 [Aspergillus niger CBS 101883]|uniref:Uncharacterized protein n=2 Tax=Aspergillus niger TaxID=5061 RepID=A2QQI6_ASPNC|nr:uncharacterized protein BO96DRAFT_464467 [Aspergillus niger CBS 101883]XP_059603923.1 hypothetical protein An08g02650 [Aspergillus niger]PYH59124.1 hypothetical protein BO96DRAFT_464467 [Aspergillus niger CBS 101883]CAK45302.1 hypothetical protein An08g02650 [Aspergillus niger]